MKLIDLRSDTVTQPTPAMRRAMHDAEVGDDCYGEDPTVSRLQELAAERTGKEAALLVSSGTQGNLISILAQCARGEEVILGDKSHAFLFEGGGPSVMGGVLLHPVRNELDGSMLPEQIDRAVRADDIELPRTRLLVIENTHNRSGGAVLCRAQLDAMLAVARRHGLGSHLDGARIFNAAVALGVDVRELIEPFDTLTFCLTKGLAAPFGALVCGSERFIKTALRIRKLLGGAMRQAGIMAAAGIVALDQMVDRLIEDHDNARRLAAGLAETGAFDTGSERVSSNIFICNITQSNFTAPLLARRCARHGLLLHVLGEKRLRMVTHWGIGVQEIDRALTVIKEVLRSNGS
ncbi:MAG: low-specificity L-threonine aldolase [Anaerolineales bacterium]|nr:low-specificity L-threonine aldolase [Anaerolineales bacterium]